MKRILLADDESAPSEIIKYFIKANGLPLEVVGETHDGEETVQAILKKHPDIVFLDIEMPLLNGLQVMEKVRKSYQGDVDFIIVTAFDSFSYAQQALKMQAKDFLLKPVMYPQFCETMERVVGYRYSDHPAFNDLLEYMNSHYMEEITLEECSRIMLMSESNVARFFKKYMDTTFTAYLNDVRMREARKLMSGGMAIKEAANATGYNNLNYFYRIFKKKYHITPKEFTDHAGL